MKPRRPEPRIWAAVCGIPIAVADTREAARIVLASAGARALQVHLCNAYTLSLSSSDDRLFAALNASDLNLADGTPVAWLLRAHGARRAVRGADLLHAVVRDGLENNVGHYFYGGWQGVAQAAAKNIQLHFPSIRVVGTETPPATDLSKSEMIDFARRVKASGADVLWIGLGTPRQDYLVHRLATLLDIPLVPIGAVFDFEAGTVESPPGWIQGSGLEWLYRLWREPRRLWRRYLFGNPKFVMLALRHGRRLANPSGSQSVSLERPQRREFRRRRRRQST